jgi:ABC-type Mn2+/Zn2+ transport system ATPase subunit
MLIGIFLRHIKAYKNINFIPVGSKYNFVSYLGENGVGKSSILQTMDSFFNEEEYFINKSSLNEGNKEINFPYLPQYS